MTDELVHRLAAPYRSAAVEAIQERLRGFRPVPQLVVATPIDPARVCLVCGLEMWDQGCKLRCQRCGYYQSCSDLL